MNTANNGTVQPLYTIGFGNNLFQYCFSRLIAEKNGLFFFHNPSPTEQEGLFKVGIDSIEPPNTKEFKELKTILVTDDDSRNILAADEIPDANYLVRGYFEDYELYKPYLDKIRSWFPKVEKTNHNDLIIHMRLQNRLIQESHHKNHISAEGFIKGIEQFDFNHLHIVTDAEKWSYYNEDDIEKIRYHVKNGPNPPSNSSWVSVERSKDYMNSLIEGFEKYNPIAHCNGAKMIKGTGGLRGDFMNDFNLIRSFDKIMLYNSTFSWWAAALSEATQVGAFGPWKPRKHNCRNLGKTDFPGWFGWGSAEDLYWDV
jgi:hypothetical protein